MRVEAHRLRIALGLREVLNGIDFVASTGELTAVIGPNGAGKSTLLRVLAGLLTPTDGEVTLAGRPIVLWKAQERARAIAYLPQERTVHWSLNTRSVVALGRLPHQTLGVRENATDRAAIHEALMAMDIAHLTDRPVLELSGGERARVLVARALAQRPAVLLADEPSAGLDPAHQLTLFRYFTALAAAGRTLIVALHDLSLAARFCHRIVLVNDGCTVAAGAPADVLTIEHLAAVYGIRAHLRTIDGIPVVLPVDVLP